MDDLALLSPLLIVMTMGLTALLVGVFTPNDQPKGWLAYVVSFGFLLGLGAIAWLWAQAPVTFGTTAGFGLSLTIDHFGLALCATILVGATLMTLSAVHYLPAQNADHGEYYALLAFSVLGMMALVLAADLVTFFIGLETMSIAIYVLAGFKRHSRFSTESAMKYFVLGAFASAILLMGMSFTFGATGTLSMHEIGQAITRIEGTATMDIANIGLVLLLGAFFFKIAAAPFHMWTPDVYEGAPATVTGFMAIGVKVAAFGGFARLILTAFGGDAVREGAVPWEMIVALVAAISMTAGNLMALSQKNLKRMLAYSAIAHTGYIMMALVVTPTAPGGLPLNALGAGLTFYLFAYALSNAVAFGVAAAVSDNDVEDVDEAAYAGLGRRSPGLGFALTIAMLSLLGIPLTAGFMGKLTIFEEVVANGDYLWLVVLAAVNSIVSAGYYLRVILVTYMKDESDAQPIQLLKSRPLAAAVGIGTALTLFIGLLPGGVIEASGKAGQSLAQTAVPGVLKAKPHAAADAVDAEPVVGIATAPLPASE